MNYLMRGWIVEAGLKKNGEALSIYKRMADLGSDDTLPSSMHGFSLLFSGKKKEAVKWMDDILLDNTDTDGLLNYMGACLYAQADETEKAFTCLEKALDKGYSNRYNITLNDDARVNIAPLRKGDRLTRILSNYSYIFE